METLLPRLKPLSFISPLVLLVVVLAATNGCVIIGERDVTKTKDTLAVFKYGFFAEVNHGKIYYPGTHILKRKWRWFRNSVSSDVACKIRDKRWDYDITGHLIEYTKTVYHDRGRSGMGKRGSRSITKTYDHGKLVKVERKKSPD